jgi:hypothetical protein
MVFHDICVKMFVRVEGRRSAIDMIKIRQDTPLCEVTPKL